VARARRRPAGQPGHRRGRATGRVDRAAAGAAGDRAEQGAGHLDIAERHFLAVIDVDARLADVQTRAHHVLNLANLYQQRGDLPAARERYGEVLAMIDPSADRELAANAYANLRVIDAEDERSRASLGMGPAMDERTASDLGLFLVNQNLAGALAGLSIVFVDGATTPARLAGVELGGGLPRIAVALPDGRAGRLDLSAVWAVTVHLADGGERLFGGSQDPPA
jgi:hypothetical protein